jgi:adenosine/AMP kinase
VAFRPHSADANERGLHRTLAIKSSSSAKAAVMFRAINAAGEVVQVFETREEAERGWQRNRPPVAACNHLPAAYHGMRSSPCRSAAMELTVVPIVKPDDANFIFGQSHFIKTVEDLHEALVGAVPRIRFGLAFCEASGKRLVRWSGNDEASLTLARNNALAIGAGHTFLIFLGDGFFPVNVLAAVRAVPEVCRIYCATANPTQVIVAQTELGRGVLGVVDGASPLGVETDTDIAWRKDLLRKIGYKL